MFAQESVMDIKKEREAFESVFTETRGWDLTFIMGCYQNIETLRAFAGWQAAKAQAVPDTYTPIVLALEDVQSKIAKTSFLTMDEENENEVMAVNANELAAYIDELIEAQVPTND